MKDINAKRFNTIIGNGFKPDQLDFIHQNGLMCVPFSSDDYLKVRKDQPALLAWYLADEPENAHTPEKFVEAYAHLKATDPNHPAGLCNYLLEALGKFKEGCDFTMTDVYPVTKDRDVPLKNVGIHIDQARAVHGNADRPHWAYIQDFGGPETDGGKWAQPTPAEVRCMTFIALIHRVQGILYFSYWPKAPATWDSIGTLNKDLEKIIPLLLAEGTERKASSTDEKVQVRARKIGDGWLIIAVNTERSAAKTTLNIEGLADAQLRIFGSARKSASSGGKITDELAPLEAKVYTAGISP